MKKSLSPSSLTGHRPVALPTAVAGYWQPESGGPVVELFEQAGAYWGRCQPELDRTPLSQPDGMPPEPLIFRDLRPHDGVLRGWRFDHAEAREDPVILNLIAPDWLEVWLRPADEHGFTETWYRVPFKPPT